MWLLNKDKCVSCGECIGNCPFRVLEMSDGFPRIKQDAECASCYVCADSCPENAIELTMDKSAS